MKKLLFISALFIILTTRTFANNLQISNVSYNASDQTVTFNISWENSWRGTGNHDAAWIFIKYREAASDQWSSVDIISGTSVGNLSIYTNPIAIGSFGTAMKGIYISRADSAQGNITSTLVSLKLEKLNVNFPDLKVFGIEMVYIPGQTFGGHLSHYLGDEISTNCFKESTNSRSYLIDYNYPNLIFLSPGNGNISLTNPGSAISFSNQNPGNYIGSGALPFYCMKYEISQLQYVEFLNTLRRSAQKNRVAANIAGTSISNTYIMSNTTSPTNRNSLRCNSVRYHYTYQFLLRFGCR